MAIVIEMPKLSDTMEEGAIAAWHKKEGDQVKEGDLLAEIETDKATMDYESPESGTLLKIIVNAGESCDLSRPIAVLGEPGEQVDVDALVSKDKSPEPAPAEAPPRPEQKASPAPEPSSTVQSRQPTQTAATLTRPSGRVRSSPLARKIATERGIDIGQIAGSGPNGRVILRDIENEPSPALPQSPAPQAETVRVPLSMMRKTIAKRLLAAKNEAPHFYLTVSVEMDSALAWRERLNAAEQKDNDIRVSVNDLICFAVIKSLLRHPDVNAAWADDAIIQYHTVHLAQAVALPAGLVTPVIRTAEGLGIRALAKTSRSLIQKTKAGELGNEDYAGGTFTVSNLGMFGIDEFTAIINPPQAAILAVGRTQKIPSVQEDGTLGVQSLMKMTLSCDHRVIDGAAGAQFLQTLKKFLEDPLTMLE